MKVTAPRNVNWRTDSDLRKSPETFTLATGAEQSALQKNFGKKPMAMPQDSQTIERRTIAKVSWRLLPLVALAYCIAYIDRSNISVAALTMNKDLGFNAYIYGWGAGIFFFSYFLFEIPSNLILEKVGARLWIARIMITWGIFSGLTAFVTGTTSFLVVRFL
ncbi:MAG: transporter, family, tartrate transporter, partial [Bradyrhizobium sp.]|nr:transporter, family, tartrate transporter [Bradyrhizobium sp.]